MNRLACWSLLLFASTPLVPAAELWHFTGSNCGACRQMEPVIAQLAQAGVPIRSIDVNRFAELAEQCQVRSIPTCIRVEEGRETGRITGTASPDELVTLLRDAPAPNPHSATPSPIQIRGQSPRESWPSQIADGSPPSDWPPFGTNAGVPVEQPAIVPPRAMPGDATAPTAVRDAPIAKAIRATVRLKVLDQHGSSFGTGTIIDVHGDEALILTCGHIFRESKGNGQVLCDLFDGSGKTELPGRVISYDLRRDVALVSIRAGHAVEPVSVGGGGRRPKSGDPAFAVGCNHGAEPTVLQNRILAVNRYHGPANLVVGGRPVDGRSGGGLFASDGTLIGVCNAADKEADEGLYAALGPIHAELDAANLGFIYRRDTLEVATRPDGSSSATPRSPLEGIDQPGRVGSRERGADSPSIPMSVAGMTPGKTGDGSADQGALSEIIFIRRDPAFQGRTDRVFVIDHPSEDLLRQIATELSRRGPHSNTGWDSTAEPGSFPQTDRRGLDRPAAHPVLRVPSQRHRDNAEYGLVPPRP